MTIPAFQRKILTWHKKNRRDMPWRRTRNPYRILVSEIMLQQTQISRVMPKYKEFLQAFPTIESLAKASDKKLLKVWSGLGYWRRAKYLKETAKILVQDFSKDPKELKKFLLNSPYPSQKIIDALLKDNLIKKKGSSHFSL